MATKKVVMEGASPTSPQIKEMVRQMVDGELTRDQVQAIFERKNPFGESSPPTEQLRRGVETISQYRVPIYKTIEIELGTFRSSKELRMAVRAKETALGQNSRRFWSDDTLDQIEVARERTEVELVVLWSEDYPHGDFTSPCPGFENLRNWGNVLELETCPAEVGPQLYLQYEFDPNEYVPDSLCVVMDPLQRDQYRPAMFNISRDERKSATPTLLCAKQNIDEQYCLFVRPKLRTM